MIIKLIDQLTSDFAARYVQDIRAAESALFKALDKPTLGSSKDSSELSRQIREDYQVFDRSQIAQLLSRHMEVLIDFATNGESIAPKMLEQLKRLVEEVINSVSTQKERDYNLIETRYRAIAIKAQMITNAYGWSRTASILAAKQQFKSQIRFTALDRSGKRWDAQTYIKTVIRHALLTIYNESKLYWMNSQGVGLFLTQHDSDENHPHHKMLFGILESKEFPTYEQIKSEVFHPNSRVIVAG